MDKYKIKSQKLIKINKEKLKMIYANLFKRIWIDFIK